jgi:hypothetical protein
MKNIKLLLLAALAVFTFNSCEEDTPTAQGTNYITFAKSTFSEGVDVGGSKTVDIVLYSTLITGSDRSFEIVVDPTSTAAAGSYTVPTSVTIPSGTNEGVLSIVLTDTNLGIGVNSLKLSVGPQEGLSRGGTATLNYIQNCTEVTATLSITFDGYGSETGWRVTDALGGVVASKAAGDYADGQASASESITLCAGRDYTFTITDSYGDGLSFPANGSYSLTIGGVTKATGGGDFGSSQATAFDTK